MSDSADRESGKSSSWGPQAFVSNDDFDRVPFNDVIRNILSADDHRLEVAFMDRARQSYGVEPDFSAYRLLGSLCGLHFRVDDKAGPFGPQVVFGDRRSAKPEDWVGEQNVELHKLIGHVEHPALRARIADVVWTNDRKKGDAAKVAVIAYCECVEALSRGHFEERFASKNAVSLEEVDLVQRAATIHAATSKSNAPMSARVAESLQDLYEKARQHLDLVPLERLASLLIRYGLISTDDLAAQMELAATTAQQDPQAYPLAIQSLFDLAAWAHEESSRPEDQRLCQIASVELTLRMASQVEGAAAKAHWYRKAIGELRRVPKTEDRREELRQELRSLQERSLDETGSIFLPTDLNEVAIKTVQEFEGLSLAEALWSFSRLVRLRSDEQMRSDALRWSTGLAASFGSTYVDNEGKIIAEVEGAPYNQEPSDKWLKSKMAQQMDLSIHLALRGEIEPARLLLSSSFAICERHFHAIAVNSPLIPITHAITFSLGFARLFQGDFMSAGALLIPQLEACLRHISLNNSLDTSKMRNDLTQEDRTLSVLLDVYKADLIKVLGATVVLHIDLLFNVHPGPALRHEYAHGKVGDRGRNDPSIYYACCFIFYLACVPLAPYWEEVIAPAIEAGSF